MFRTASIFEDVSVYGVVCHDAGAANQVVSMHLEYGWVPSFVYMSGPAKIIWQSKLPGLCSLQADWAWLDQVEFVITGTGWASDDEYLARKAARERGVPTAAVLDHWVNYRERFVRDGVEVLPDELWVFDDYAEGKAREFFTNRSVVLMEDCYAGRELREIVPISTNTPNVLLYLLEPIRNDWGRGESGEFQALRFFLEHLHLLRFPVGTEVHLRIHPSESAEKYNSFLNHNARFPVRIVTGSLAQAISNSRWVAGCQTYAMALSLQAGRKVFGALPPWAHKCALPHQGIVHLRDLVRQ